jgi:hypothetical protein
MADGLRRWRVFSAACFHHPLARHLEQHLTIIGVIRPLRGTNAILREVFVELGL